jgi:hypothetical protein
VAIELPCEKYLLTAVPEALSRIRRSFRLNVRFGIERMYTSKYSGEKTSHLVSLHKRLGLAAREPRGLRFQTGVSGKGEAEESDASSAKPDCYLVGRSKSERARTVLIRVPVSVFHLSPSFSRTLPPDNQCCSGFVILYQGEHCPSQSVRTVRGGGDV